MILVDSNVLIDIVQDDPEWADWSMDRLVAGARDGVLAYNQVIVAEVAPRFGSLEVFADFGRQLGLAYASLDEEAALGAGLAFAGYRRNRGTSSPSIPLPDFFIGGHAQAAGAAILTRDARFYRSYFPQVELITPETQP